MFRYLSWETRLIIIIILSLTAGVFKLYSMQNFVCNKVKNVCYSTTFGFIPANTIKINELEGITITIGSKTVTHGRRYNRTTETYATYMPTLTTKQGQRLPFYSSPTSNMKKAEADRDEFKNFMRQGSSELKLENSDNYGL